MSILYITPECRPFRSVGGVGVVAGDLLPELAKLGLAVGVVMPKHGGIPPRYIPETAEIEYEVSYGGRRELVRVFRGCLPGTEVDVWFLENTTYFGGHAVFTFDEIPFESDVRRYSFFAKACLPLIKRLDPDTVHVNDWTGGYLLGWMELANIQATGDGERKPFPQRRILSIHNIGYQGQTWKRRLNEAEFRDLATHPTIGPLFDDPRPEYDCVNPMRLAMELADIVNAVSPTNADEITRPPNADAFFLGGQGLESVALRLRAEGRLRGILNGMRYPREQPGGEFEEEFLNLMGRKRDEKLVLSRFFADPGGLLLGFVGRAVEQKFVLLAEQLDGRPVFEHILELPNVNVLVLATGQPEYEAFLGSLAIARFSGRRSYDELLGVSRRRNYAAIVTHDPQIGQRIQLGCDVFLMPSRDEPCGITQFESMAVGTPPLVRETGGLKDTVVPHTEPSGTGFRFDGTSRDSVLRGLVNAVGEAARVFHDETDHFRTLQQNAYRARFLWADTAGRYLDELYACPVRGALPQSATATGV